MNINILQAKDKDLEEVARMYDLVNDYLATTINYPGWKKGIYPARRDAKESIEEASLHLVKIKDVIVGSVVLNHKPEEEFNQVKWLIDEDDYSNIIVVRTLMVHPDYLSLGIAQSLIDYTYEFAKKNGFKSIRLDVYEKNIPAIKLYEKNNYKYIDTVDLGLVEFGLKYFKLYELLVK
jgi:ribosomal protein S18 acetylase RimI-like enzyme